jgi:hypothetical protein
MNIHLSKSKSAKLGLIKGRKAPIRLRIKNGVRKSSFQKPKRTSGKTGA